MESTIQGLLDFSRPPSVQRQRHDLRNILRRAFNLVQGRTKRQQVRIDARLLDRELWVDGDPEQLHQVCVNLLINGVEAMSFGGVLEIKAEQDLTSNRLRVRFHDFGPGISEEVLTNMFEPFVSTKIRGTGLGLAISRRIVTQHGGTLIAENHSDGGAVLTLELPAAGEGLSREPALYCDGMPASADSP
jgi:C4-dicarboxylate-specific signal transduction histidine kinase